jgi:hypothetical protein
MSRFIVAFFCFSILAGSPAFGQDLSIDVDDLVLDQSADEGFHLFIRKKPGISSVLLAESTKDPEMNMDNYAYRAPYWNPINGDELRLLDGVPHTMNDGTYPLLSSTPETHPVLGEAFHIFIPWIVVYGREDDRYGAVYMSDGTFINIRAFSFPYADYRGRFADNPYVLKGVQRAVENPEEPYMTEAEKSFDEIARQGNGDFIYADDPSDLIDKIKSLLEKEAGKDVDLVLCMDSTGSMGRYIDSVRKMLIPMIRGMIADFTDFRIGMVVYRDYPPDVYITRVTAFTKDFNVFQRNLNAISAWGGGDIPEAVFEALYDGVEKFPWAAESRLLILVGDAPPHPVPKGTITAETVFEKAAEKEIKLSAILLPQ